MDKTLQNKLYNKYWSMLTGDVAEYGFMCGDGWYDLLDDTLNQVNQTDDDCQIVQIKEKFGQLRVYGKVPRDARTIIDEAERQSVSICDVCGSQGHRQLLNESVVATRCEQHNTNDF